MSPPTPPAAVVLLVADSMVSYSKPEAEHHLFVPHYTNSMNARSKSMSFG